MLASSLLRVTLMVCLPSSPLYDSTGPTYLPPDCDAEAMLKKIQRLSELISRCFYRSSRKDRLIKVVRDSIDTGTWYPCLYDLDNWSDWERFAALELLVAAVGVGREGVLHSFLLTSHTDAQVPQAEKLTPATQESSDFVAQLRTICDSVLYAYLSKVADTAEKRYYLDLSYTIVTIAQGRLRDLVDLDKFLDNLHKYEVLEPHFSVFQPYDVRVLFATTEHFSSKLSHHITDFRSDPERSKEFHYEGRPQWDTIIATRYMRCLRTRSNSR